MSARGKGIGARWEREVLSFLPDGEVIYSEGENDYSGSERVVVRCDAGHFAVYEWSYGSCSGCDKYDSIRDYDDVNEAKMMAEIAKDVASGVQRLPSLEALRAFIAASNWGKSDGYGYSEKSGALP